MSELDRSERTRYDLGLLFTDGLPEHDDGAGYRGAGAARGGGRSIPPREGGGRPPHRGPPGRPGPRIRRARAEFAVPARRVSGSRRHRSADCLWRW